MKDAHARLIDLANTAVDEGQRINWASFSIAVAHFANSVPGEQRPKITLTPEGRVRAHWADGAMREF